MAYQGDYEGTDEEQCKEWIEDVLDTPLEDTTAVDSLDQLSGRDSCGYAQRATSAAVFPPSIDVKSHQLGLASHGDT